MTKKFTSPLVRKTSNNLPLRFCRLPDALSSAIFYFISSFQFTLVFVVDITAYSELPAGINYVYDLIIPERLSERSAIFQYQLLNQSFLLHKDDKDEGEMNMLASMTEGMKNFAQRYNIAINDPRLVKLYQMEQDAIRDKKSRLNFARS